MDGHPCQRVAITLPAQSPAAMQLLQWCHQMKITLAIISYFILASSFHLESKTTTSPLSLPPVTTSLSSELAVRERRWLAPGHMKAGWPMLPSSGSNATTASASISGLVDLRFAQMTRLPLMTFTPAVIGMPRWFSSSQGGYVETRASSRDLSFGGGRVWTLRVDEISLRMYNTLPGTSDQPLVSE